MANDTTPLESIRLSGVNGLSLAVKNDMYTFADQLLRRIAQSEDFVGVEPDVIATLIIAAVHDWASDANVESRIQRHLISLRKEQSE